jgi:hypothetical protein
MEIHNTMAAGASGPRHAQGRGINAYYNYAYGQLE